MVVLRAVVRLGGESDPLGGVILHEARGCRSRVPHVPEVLGRRSPHLDILARLGRARNFGIIESLLPSGPMVRLSGPLVASCRRPTSGS